MAEIVAGGGGGGRRHDRQLRPAEAGQEWGVGRGQAQPHGQVVDRLELLDPDHAAVPGHEVTAVRGVGGIDLAGQVPHHRRGVERGAVREADTRPELERPGGAEIVDRPRPGQPRGQLAGLGLVADQRVVQEQVDLGRVGVGGPGRIERHRVGRPRDHQGPGPLGRPIAPGQPGQVAPGQDRDRHRGGPHRHHRHHRHPAGSGLHLAECTSDRRLTRRFRSPSLPAGASLDRCGPG